VVYLEVKGKIRVKLLLIAAAVALSRINLYI
jgi:hypothetical protein